MLKNVFKKLVATACAGAMLISSSAFVLAANDDETVISEYDFSDVVTYLDKADASRHAMIIGGGTTSLNLYTEEDADPSYVQLEVGNRNGANASVGWGSGTIDAAHGVSAQALIGRFASDGRGPKMNFTVPSSKTEGKRLGVRFNYYPVNSSNNSNSADLLFADPKTSDTIATLAVGSVLTDKTWHDIEVIIETTGDYFVLVNDLLAAQGKMTASTFPQIKFTNENSSAEGTASNGYIDNVVLYSGGITSDDMYLSMQAGNIALDTTQSSITEDGDRYIVIDNFELPTLSNAAVSLSWSALQKAKDSDSEWTSTDFVRFNGNDVIIAPTSDIDNYDVKLVATLSYKGLTETKEFNLLIKTPQTVAEEAVKDVTVKKTDYSSADKAVVNIAEGSIISDDVILDRGDEIVPISWKSYVPADGDGGEGLVESDIISPVGAFTPSDYSGEITLVATATYKRVTATKEFKFNVDVASTVYSDMVNTAITSASVKDSKGAALEEGSEVTADLTLVSEAAVGSKTVPITWTCYKPGENEDDKEQIGVITPTGVFMPTDYSGKVILEATASYGGEKVTKSFEYTVPDAITTYIDPVIKALKAKSADNTAITEYTDYDIDMYNIGTINYDLQLPVSIPVSDGKVTVEWKALTDNITITDKGVAQYTTSDFNAHDAEVEGTFTYVKNSTNLVSKTPASFKYKVQFTEDDKNSDASAGKGRYKVRFDAAYDANFSSIPSQTATDITLPTTGYFGSTISWSSSSPGIISASGKFTQPVSTANVVLNATITAPDTSETSKYSKSVTVYGTGLSSGSSGGRVSSGTTRSSITGTSIANTPTTKTTVTNTNTAPVVTEPTQPQGFTDLGSVDWAVEAINGLAEKGVISGKSDTEFAPNDNVTRAEFAKILVGAFGIETGSSAADFTDVSEEDWFYSFVAAAYEKGIIGGYDDGRFGPNDLITRQDMAVMVKRAVDATGKSLEAVNAAITFDDDALTADYAKEAVSALQQAGIINGTSDTTFSPLDNATRAQAAKILYSFCD